MDTTALESWCVTWLMRERAWLKYESLRRHDVKPQEYDEAYVIPRFEGAISFLRRGDRLTAVQMLREIQSNLAGEVLVLTRFPKYLATLVNLLQLSDAGKRSEGLRRLWFDMVHDWRGTTDKGMSWFAFDMARFTPISLLMAVFLGVAGIVIPAFGATGYFMALPGGVFAVACGVYSILGRLRNQLHALLLGLPLIIVLLLFSAMLTPLAGDGVIISCLCAVLVGELINLHVVYGQVWQHIGKYGAMTSLWVRRVGKRECEALLISYSGELVWRRIFTGWFSIFSTVIGLWQLVSLRGNTRFRYAPDFAYEGWLQCVPATITTRMVGSFVRRPKDWAEAVRTTEGLTPELVDEFFAHLPSPLEPPNYAQLAANPALTVPADAPW